MQPFSLNLAVDCMAGRLLQLFADNLLVSQTGTVSGGDAVTCI